MNSAQACWIPPGFAHGYCTLSETADVFYKVTAAYDPERARGLRWNDPQLGIQWPISDPILSDADRRQPTLERCENPFRVGAP